MERPDVRRRVILLGASNLTLGLPWAVRRIREDASGAVEILAAHGPGRSFGKNSRILGRGLPGHIDSSLWEHLRRSPEPPTRALITDIGNDILYGVPPGQLLDWIHECLDRLEPFGATTTITLLPLEGVRALGTLRFKCLRTVLFPGRRDALPDVLEKSERVQEGLLELGDRPGVELVKPDPSWYGFDPIHPRRRHRGELWERILANWPAGESRPPPSLAERAALRLLRPREWSYMGFTLSGRQPARRWSDGSELYLY